MKKINLVLSFLMGTSLIIWVMKALLDYINYTRHIELFAANGWLWYDGVLSWGKVIIPLVAICLIAKFIIRKCVVRA